MTVLSEPLNLSLLYLTLMFAVLMIYFHRNDSRDIGIVTDIVHFFQIVERKQLILAIFHMFKFNMIIHDRLRLNTFPGGPTALKILLMS